MSDATMSSLSPTRHCKILLVPGAFSLDVFAPLEVFAMGARLWAQRRHWDPALGAADAPVASQFAGEPGA